MTVIPCMGGWCKLRASCPNYYTDSKRQPAERLCKPGEDGVVKEIPVEPVDLWKLQRGKHGRF